MSQQFGLTVKLERRTIFSPDRRYRYTLWRQWDKANDSFVHFIGLNPSTADETENDPTVRRCISFAKAWGYGALCITNLFAFRATKPEDMKASAEPVGQKNDAYLRAVAIEAAANVAAWGEEGAFLNRSQAIIKSMRNLQCLGLTKKGHPRHPLRLPKNTILQPLI